MKRGWKIFWITCAVVVGIGLVCCVLSLALGVTREAILEQYPNGIGIIYRDNFTDEEYLPKIEDGIMGSYTDIRDIDADMYAGELYIEESDGANITVETEGVSKIIGFRCTQEGNTLKLRTREHIVKLAGNLGGKVTVYIPKDMFFDEVSLDLAAGSLYVENLHAKEFSVDIGAGEAIIDQFEAIEADISNGVGEVTVTGEANTLDIECGAGDVTYYAQGKDTDYNYDIECGIGEISIGSREYSGLAEEYHIDNKADKDISIECGVGGTTIYFNN